MPLQEDYPKTNRDYYGRLQKLLERDSRLNSEQRDALAMALNDMADKARDLEDIVQRLLNESHTSAEIGELLIAFELTTEQIRGSSDVIDGKLYEIADRLKGTSPTRKKAKGKPARR